MSIRKYIVLITAACAWAQQPAWRAQVEALKAKGDASGALAILERATSTAEAEDEKGFLLAVLGKRDEAIPHFEKALALNAKYSPAAFHLGVALWLKEPGERALAYLKIASEQKPQEFDYRSRYGQALDQMGRYAEAAREFKAASTLRPADGR